jgi:hypothetical protein
MAQMITPRRAAAHATVWAARGWAFCGLGPGGLRSGAARLLARERGRQRRGLTSTIHEHRARHFKHRARHFKHRARHFKPRARRSKPRARRSKPRARRSKHRARRFKHRARHFKHRARQNRTPGKTFQKPNPGQPPGNQTPGTSFQTPGKTNQTPGTSFQTTVARHHHGAGPGVVHFSWVLACVATADCGIDEESASYANPRSP